jgi:hypothetical protein
MHYSLWYRKALPGQQLYPESALPQKKSLSPLQGRGFIARTF